MTILTTNSVTEPELRIPPVDGKGPASWGRSSAITGSKTLTESAGGMTPDELREWISIQIPYENFADNEEIAGLARQWLNVHRDQFQSRTHNLYEKWSNTNNFIRGSANITRGRERDVHNPACYTALERMIPRIEEGVFSQNPWFRAVGRESMDQRQAEKLRAYMEYQLDACGFEGDVQSHLRVMLTYGFCVLKVWWHTETDPRIDRKYTKEMVNGKTNIKVKLTEKEVITYNGPKIRLVDPFDFFIDTKVANYKDAQIIGDYTEMTLSQIDQCTKQGIFKGVEELYKEPPRKRHDYTTSHKEDRSLDYFDDSVGANVVKGGDVKYPVLEMWGKFDLFGTGIPRECVVTVVNDKHVVRVQENPFDDKHRPYAVIRCARDAFDFFSTAPFDHAIRLNVEMDRHRQLVMRGHDNSMNPVIFVGDQEDLPDSLMEVEVGAIIPVRDPSGITQVKTPSTLREWSSMEMVLEGNIEEVTGSSKMLSGTEDSGTATESSHKLLTGIRFFKEFLSVRRS